MTPFPDKETEAVTRVVDLLEEKGVNLPFPYSSKITGSEKLFELRVNHRVIRILYAFDPSRNAVLLLGGSKEGDDRFYQREVPRAETLYARYLEERE